MTTMPYHKAETCPICASHRAFCFFRWGYELSVCLRCRFVYISGNLRSGEAEYGAKFYDNVNYHNNYLTNDVTEITESLLLIQRYTSTTQRVFCDIGCSIGNGLIEAKKCGFNVFGVELSKEAALIARKRSGAPVVVKSIQELTPSDVSKVDVFYLNHVIEHLPDPAGIISKLRNLSNPRGLLWVNVPNVYGLQRNLLALCGNPKSHAVGEHCNFFSPNAMRKLLEKCGYEVIVYKKVFFHFSALFAPINLASRALRVADSFAVLARRSE